TNDKSLRQSKMGQSSRLRPNEHTIRQPPQPGEKLLPVLWRDGVRSVVDVRTLPRSRSNPQFNTEVLPSALADAGIGYEHIAALGGLRSRRRELPAEVNAFWQNASFHNYADYAMSPHFAEGLARLRELGRVAPCAVMCA